MRRRSVLRLFLYSTASGGIGTALASSRVGSTRRFSVKDFGAVGNGIVDDSRSIQAAVATAAKLGGGEVFLPSGTYRASGIQLFSNIRLIGESRDYTKLRETTGTSYLVSVNPGMAGFADPEHNQRDIEIANIAFEGPVVSMGFSEHRHLLNFNGVTNLDVHDCAIRGFRGDGVYLGSSNVAGLERHNVSVRFARNEFDGLNHDNRNGISVIDGTGVLIEQNQFIRCSRPTMPGPIDIEPNGNVFQRISNIAILKNRFQDCGGNVAKISVHIPVPEGSSHTVSDLRIEGNTILKDQRSGNGLYVRVLRHSQAMNAKPTASKIYIGSNVIDHGNSSIQGVDAFLVEKNTFSGDGYSTVWGATGRSDTEYANHGRITMNEFRGRHGRGGALVVGRAIDLEVSNNRFASASPGPVIVFSASGGQPMCRNVRLVANEFSDHYATDISSMATATTDHVRVAESNRTFTGRSIVTSGFR